jgi:hypothetical protein
MEITFKIPDERFEEVTKYINGWYGTTISENQLLQAVINNISVLAEIHGDSYTDT